MGHFRILGIELNLAYNEIPPLEPPVQFREYGLCPQVISNSGMLWNKR